MGELQKRIKKEFSTAAQMQYTPLRPRNAGEIAGMLESGMLPNIEKIVEEMRKERPKQITLNASNKFEPSKQELINRLQEFWYWSERWLK